MRRRLPPLLALGLALGCAPADVPWPGPGPSPDSAAELRLARLGRRLAAEATELDPIAAAAVAWPDVAPDALRARGRRLRDLTTALDRLPATELSEPWRREQVRLQGLIAAIDARTSTDAWASDPGPWLEVLELRAGSADASEPGRRWIEAAEARLETVRPRPEHVDRLDVLIASGPAAWRERLSAWRAATLEPSCTSSVGMAR